MYERSGDKRIEKVIKEYKKNRYLLNFNYFCVSKKNDEKNLKWLKFL